MTIGLQEVQDRIFSSVPWDQIDKKKARENPRVLELLRQAGFVESYFGIYVGHMMDMFWYDIDATCMIAIEAFEAYTHFYKIRRYLSEAGYTPITDEEVRELRERGKDLAYEDEITELVDFMGSEHFAANFFRDLSELTTEPVLKGMLQKMSKEEVSHSQFAYELLAKRLRANPALKDRILGCAKNYKHIGKRVMPTVSDVKEDNIKAIQEFSKRIHSMVGESISESKAKG